MDAPVPIIFSYLALALAILLAATGNLPLFSPGNPYSWLIIFPGAPLVGGIIGAAIVYFSPPPAQ